MPEDLRLQLATIKKIFEEGDWLSVEEISRLQRSSQKVKSLLIDWKASGHLCSVFYGGKEYYARYQFDSLCRPRPVIKDILDAYGAYLDTWSVAAWYHFPNSWIIEVQSSGAVPVAPKDALHRCEEVIKAARNRKGTYVT